MERGQHVVELLASVRNVSTDLLTNPRLREWIERADTNSELTSALTMMKQADTSLKTVRQLVLANNGDAEELNQQPSLSVVHNNRVAVETNTSESHTPSQNNFLSSPPPQIFSPPPALDSHKSFDSSQAIPTNEQVPSMTAEPINPKIEPTSPKIEPTSPQIKPTNPQIEPTNPQIEPANPQIEPASPQIGENQSEPQQQSHEESFEGDELFADFDSLVMEIDDVVLSQSGSCDESSDRDNDDVVIVTDQQEEPLVTIQEIADDKNKDVFDEAVLG